MAFDFLESAYVRPDCLHRLAGESGAVEVAVAFMLSPPGPVQSALWLVAAMARLARDMRSSRVAETLASHADLVPALKSVILLSRTRYEDDTGAWAQVAYETLWYLCSFDHPANPVAELHSPVLVDAMLSDA